MPVDDTPMKQLPHDDTDPGETRDWRSTAGGVAVVGLAVGWFLLSHFVMNTDVSDAIGEGIGAALGLLVALSIVGAVMSARAGARGRGSST